MRGKLIVMEGTDCSGKETQSNKLIERLNNEGIKVFKFSFPAYDTPTGKIVGGPYLGKPQICGSWFSEGAVNVPPKVASMYYAADRLYNINKVNDMLDQGYTVVLDRYVTSNMGHQGSKIKDKEERLKMYQWLDDLEYKLLGLPIPDIIFLLYMPYQYAVELKKYRSELPDQHETSEEHLRNAEAAYLELADIYHWSVINCVADGKIKSREEIHEEVYKKLIS
jgi:dTMP kinase